MTKALWPFKLVFNLILIFWIYLEQNVFLELKCKHNTLLLIWDLWEHIPYIYVRWCGVSKYFFRPCDHCTLFVGWKQGSVGIGTKYGIVKIPLKMFLRVLFEKLTQSIKTLICSDLKWNSKTFFKCHRFWWMSLYTHFEC